MSPRTAASTRAASAPARSTAPARRAPRPRLEVVPDEQARRRLRPGRVGTVAGALLFVALFALAAFQTVIIKAQGNLDDLNGRIATEQVRDRDLQLELAQMRSPERITQAATALGMIAPGEVTYLQPGPDDDARAGSSAADGGGSSSGQAGAR